MLSFILLELIAMPITNTYSRWLEKKADLFSLKLTKDLDAHISTERRLADMHLSLTKANPLLEFIFFTHPSPEKRVRYAKEYYEKMKSHKLS